MAHDDGLTFGLLNNDEFKIHVQGVGVNGFDYQSAAISYIASASLVTNETDNEDSNNKTGDEDDSEKKSEGMDTMVLGGIIGLVVLLIVAGVLVAMFLRSGRGEDTPINWGAAHSLEESTAAVPMAAAPATPAAVATPEMVADYTHLLPGGQYITGQAGETVYLAPNGTAWTMQADNSFIRTT